MNRSRFNSMLRAMALMTLCISPLAAQTMDVAVVVNEKNPISNLSMTELRKLFSGDTRTWINGTPVKLLIRAPEAQERDVVLHLLRMSEDQYAHYWTAQAYRGEGTEPVAVYSNGMQKEAVSGIPGAIALIAVADLKPGVKVLRIDGKLPGDPGYPLH